MLFAPAINIVGHWVGENKHYVWAKALHKFFNAQVPQSFKEVQAIHGQLNYLVCFAPSIAHNIAPICILLSWKGSWVWDASCTSALMLCAEHAAKRLQLGITRAGHPLHLYI